MKNIKTNYEEYYEKISLIPQQLDNEEIKFFGSLTGSKKNLKILDVGCAEGKLAVYLALEGHEVVAVDISSSYLKMARDLANENSVKIEFLKYDIENEIGILVNEKFDLIYFMDVIEHLRSPIAALENLRKLLSENGILIIHTPNVCTPIRMLSYIFNRRNLNFKNPAELHDLHLQLYDYKTLCQTLELVGLKVIEVVPTKSYISTSKSYFQYFNRFLARKFPLISANLLIKCKKDAPVNIDEQIEYWEKTLIQEQE